MPDIRAPANQEDKGPHHTCLEAWTSGAISGCLAGLLAGMIWGIVQEKKFIFRNMNREVHLMEPPIQLFSVMMRGTKTMAIMGTFFGLTRSLISEVPMTPGLHGWKATKSGVLAAGVFAAAKWVDPQDTEEALDTAAID
ncbi:MAG: hypothetical protein FRX49_10164 [Trebouxia sp. A1-2]|nr:MAG: hypothetical protein FRX49_10164 [Trebouxia sp. A1-2]